MKSSSHMKLFSLLPLALILYPSFAFAYLDPGSGSLLLSSIVALFASIIFFLKTLFYKTIAFFTGGLVLHRASVIGGGGGNPQSLVFYSEGAQYYGTFKPILDALDSLRHPYTYYTSDENDPALKRITLNQDSQALAHYVYIGKGNKAYSLLNRLKADILVLTTPGLDVLHIKRQAGVKHYCHIVHSLSPMTYRVFGVDYFDSVLVANEIQREFIRDIERAHHLLPKHIAITGSTYLDELSILKAQISRVDVNPSHPSFLESTDTLSSCRSHSPKSLDITESTNTYSMDSHQSISTHSACSINPSFSSHSIQSSSLNASCSSNTNSHSMHSSHCLETHSSDMSSVDSRSCNGDSLKTSSSSHLGSHSSVSSHSPSLTPRVLISPSWGKESLLSKYGLDLLLPLAQSGFELLIRPHPQSYISPQERRNLERLQESLKEYANVQWDRNTPNVYAFARSDVMISDFSSVIFDYVCLEHKPVITIDNEMDLSGYDMADLPRESIWTFSALNEIGYRIKPCEFDHLKDIILQTISQATSLHSQSTSTLGQSLHRIQTLLWSYPHQAGLMSALELLKIEKELLEHHLLPQARWLLRLKEVEHMIKKAKNKHTQDSDKDKRALYPLSSQESESFSSLALKPDSLSSQPISQS